MQEYMFFDIANVGILQICLKMLTKLCLRKWLLLKKNSSLKPLGKDFYWP